MRLLLLLTAAVATSQLVADTCALCASGSDCSGAYLGKPGRFCGAYNTTYGVQELCCCAKNDVCGTPSVDGQCECLRFQTDPTLHGIYWLRTTSSVLHFVTDAVILVISHIIAGVVYCLLSWCLLLCTLGGIEVVNYAQINQLWWCRRKTGKIKDELKDKVEPEVKGEPEDEDALLVPADTEGARWSIRDAKLRAYGKTGYDV